MIRSYHPLFWFAFIVSFAVGIYGVLAGKAVIFVPYLFINPWLLLFAGQIIRSSPQRQRGEIAAALILLLNAPGSVILHELGIQYDIFLHFSVGLLSFEFIRLFLIQKTKSEKTAAAAAFFLVLIGGIGFEGIQKLSDVLFGTKLFFDVAQPIQVDVLLDVTMNISGAGLGWFLFGRKSKPKSNDITPSSQ